MYLSLCTSGGANCGQEAEQERQVGVLDPVEGLWKQGGHVGTREPPAALRGVHRPVQQLEAALAEAAQSSEKSPRVAHNQSAICRRKLPTSVRGQEKEKDS